MLRGAGAWEGRDRMKDGGGRGGRAEGRITGLILDLKSPISTTSGGKVEG